MNYKNKNIENNRYKDIIDKIDIEDLKNIISKIRGQQILNFCGDDQLKEYTIGAVFGYQGLYGDRMETLRRGLSKWIVVEFEIWETVNSSTIQEKNGKTEMKAFTRSSVANCINIKRASGYKDLMLLAFLNKKERGFYKANEMY